MPTYVRLIRMTDEGRKVIGDPASILSRAKEIFEANGGKINWVWSTLGGFDFVAVVEAPDDATMMKVSAMIAQGGFVTAETLPAVPIQDFIDSLQ